MRRQRRYEQRAPMVQEKRGDYTMIIIGGVLVLILVFLAGIWFASRPSDTYVLQREAQKIESAARLTQVKDWFFTGAAISFLVAIAGGVVVGLYWLWTQTSFIRPNRGLFPVIRGRIGKTTFYHDPNRQLRGAVAYLPDANEGVRATHMGDGTESAHVQIASQAQATQLVAAAVGKKGEGLDPQGQEVVSRVAQSIANNPARMPDVLPLDTGVPDDRLLLAAVEADWQEVEDDATA